MFQTTPLVRSTPKGLYCEAGDFYIDPFRSVARAVITHAHSDHARPGSEAYLCASPGMGLIGERVGLEANIEGLAFGEIRRINGVQLSLHPAGHILGSAQVRIEHGGEVWVVSGDYKRQTDRSCESFELGECDTFITECTFGLPVYHWPSVDVVFEEINAWWRSNQQLDLTSVLFAYALGKAQRVLAGVDPAIGPIGIHGAVARFLPYYAREGYLLNPARHVDSKSIAKLKGRGLVIAPSSAQGSTWLRKFGKASTAFASGWMRIRGARRRRALDRGFIVSDHVDWDGLINTIRETRAQNIGVTHGYSSPLVRWLSENGWNAFEVSTDFAGEEEADE